jgi:hypothetical protein
MSRGRVLSLSGREVQAALGKGSRPSVDTTSGYKRKRKCRGINLRRVKRINGKTIAGHLPFLAAGLAPFLDRSSEMGSQEAR